MKKLVLLLFSLFAVIPAYGTQLYGTLRAPDGTPFNGVLYLSLAHAARISSSANCGGPILVTPATNVAVKITKGLATWPNVYGQDCMIAPQANYNALLIDSGGNTISATQWTIQGTIEDVGTIYESPTTAVDNTLKVVYGVGAPSNPCPAQTFYVQTDAVTGQNMWTCINGAYTLQVGLQGIQGPQGQGLNWRGTWSSSTNYAAGDTVFYNGIGYASLTSGNTNNTPSSATNYWGALTLQYLDVRQFGAKCDGSTDDTTAINNTYAAARASSTGSTVSYPNGTCRTSSSIDTTNVDSSGFGMYHSIVKPLTTNPSYPVFTSSGQSLFTDMQINGNWDGVTNCQTGGDGFRSINPHSNTPGSMDGYNIYFRNVRVLNTCRDSIYLNDPAYIGLHTVIANAAGRYGLTLDNTQSGWQPTTVNVSGQSTFSDNQYGFYINNAIQFTNSGVTTIEDSGGVYITGSANRGLSFPGIYFESVKTVNSTHSCYTFNTNSSGIGLYIKSNHCLETAGPSYTDTLYWGGVDIDGTNQFASLGIGSSASSYINRSYNVGNQDPVFVTNGEWFLPSTYVAIVTPPFTNGQAWHAEFHGTVTDGSTHPTNAPWFEVSSANPTVQLGNEQISCQIANNIFQCKTIGTYANVTSSRFLGEIKIWNDKQSNTSDGTYLSTSDLIRVGGVVAATGNFANGFNGTCVTGHNLVVVNGVVTGCQ